MLSGSVGISRAKGGEEVDQQDHDYSRNSHRLIPVQTTSSGDNQDNNHHFNDCDDVTVIAGLAINTTLLCLQKAGLAAV